MLRWSDAGKLENDCACSIPPCDLLRCGGVWRDLVRLRAHLGHRRPVAAQATPAPPPPALGQDRALGTPHPTVLLGAARDGSWLAICQAREDTDHDGQIEVRFGRHGESFGDRLVPYLLLRPGAGREITRYLRSDRSGRWLVYVRDGKRWLLDTHSGREIDLDAARPSRHAVVRAGTRADDLANEGAWTAGLDFDDEGRQLLFVTAGARSGRELSVVRTDTRGILSPPPDHEAAVAVAGVRARLARDGASDRRSSEPTADRYSEAIDAMSCATSARTASLPRWPPS